jgi:BolA protein
MGMNIQQNIEKILTEKFAPVHLEVINESHKHKGHAGDNGTGQSHFRVVISSSEFESENRVTCSRMVYQALDALLKDKIHALSLSIVRINKKP